MAIVILVLMHLLALGAFWRRELMSKRIYIALY